jgi:hypothetical protein
MLFTTVKLKKTYPINCCTYTSSIPGRRVIALDTVRMVVMYTNLLLCYV